MGREPPPSTLWGRPDELGPAWDWRPGKLLLGTWQGRAIGDPDQAVVGRDGDDRHLVMIAASRTGKSRTVLLPNLRRYPGSVFVIDPKGELARKSAKARAERLGQNVAVLDPFSASGWQSMSYNPLDELDPDDEAFIDNVGLVADALIIDAEKDRHWTDAAKGLLVAIILYVFAMEGPKSLPRVRQVMLGSEGSLMEAEIDGEAGLFVRMRSIPDAFGGLLATLGTSFLEKSERELSSILSVAREQLRFLDSGPLSNVLESSPLRLSTLKSQPTTVYLCLPAARLATHFRWLRLMVTLTMVHLESDNTAPEHPVLLLLEEFAALGALPPVERAAGFMAGFGVRMWTVLQDLQQLQAAYPKSWETFLGNAGVIQAFGNFDTTTTKYLSGRLGQVEIIQRQKHWIGAAQIQAGDIGEREQPRSVALLTPEEIAWCFSRETGRQLVLVPGQPPLYLDRIEEDD